MKQEIHIHNNVYVNQAPCERVQYYGHMENGGVEHRTIKETTYCDGSKKVERINEKIYQPLKKHCR